MWGLLRLAPIRPYQINLLLLGPYLPKIFQIPKKKKNHISYYFIQCHVFPAWPSILVLRGGRVVVEHHLQRMVTHLNNIGFFNGIHVLFVLFCLPKLPALSFHLGHPSNNKLIWHGLIALLVTMEICCCCCCCCHVVVAAACNWFSQECVNFVFVIIYFLFTITYCARLSYACVYLVFSMGSASPTLVS